MATQLAFPKALGPILDSQFVDDKTIYTTGMNEKLHVIHCMLNDFCQASIAQLNWGKTLGI